MLFCLFDGFNKFIYCVSFKVKFDLELELFLI